MDTCPALRPRPEEADTLGTEQNGPGNYLFLDLPTLPSPTIGRRMRACCAAPYAEPEVVEGRLRDVRPDTRTDALAQQVETLLRRTEEIQAPHDKKMEVERRLEDENRRLKQEAEIEKQKEAESRLEVEKMRLEVERLRLEDFTLAAPEARILAPLPVPFAQPSPGAPGFPQGQPMEFTESQ